MHNKLGIYSILISRVHGNAGMYSILSSQMYRIYSILSCDVHKLPEFAAFEALDAQNLRTSAFGAHGWTCHTKPLGLLVRLSVGGG